MDFAMRLNTSEISFRARIKFYKKRVQEIENYLLKNPNEWGKFQNEFNSEINVVFRELMNFEKENMNSGNENKVYKLKRIFINKVRKIFVRGEYIEWALRKPYGYAGDFKFIEDLYENNPSTTGFDRLFDNYCQMSAIANAVRNRRNDFRRFIIQFLKDRKGRPLRIMALASGPCREIREAIAQNGELCKDVIFDCYDNDQRAIDFSSTLLEDAPNVNFFKMNAVRIGLKKDIHSFIDKKYDLIYSTGLFDYFDEKLSFRIIQNLKKLLNSSGVMCISDVRDKYSNPSLYFMEWVADWNLIYRNDEDFRKIFIKSGFKENELEFRYEQQGILQYIIAHIK